MSKRNLQSIILSKLETLSILIPFVIYSVIVSAPLDQEPEPDDHQERAFLGRKDDWLTLLLSDQKSEWKIVALKEYLQREWWVRISLKNFALILFVKVA